MVSAKNKSNKARASAAHPRSALSGGEDGKPKRCLSSYNIFFQHQRAVLLNGDQKLGFAGLARTIASQWRSIDPSVRAHYEDLALDDKARYMREMKAWKEEQKKKQESPKEDNPASEAPSVVIKDEDVKATADTSLPKVLEITDHEPESLSGYLLRELQEPISWEPTMPHPVYGSSTDFSDYQPYLSGYPYPSQQFPFCDQSGHHFSSPNIQIRPDPSVRAVSLDTSSSMEQYFNGIDRLIDPTPIRFSAAQPRTLFDEYTNLMRDQIGDFDM